MRESILPHCRDAVIREPHGANMRSKQENYTSEKRKSARPRFPRKTEKNAVQWKLYQRECQRDEEVIIEGWIGSERERKERFGN